MSEKWEAFLLSDGAEVRGIDGSMIADIFAGYGVTGKISFETSVEECHARARLIAAAPDLLAACRAFVTAWEKSLQLEKTDVALILAKVAIERVEEGFK